MTVEARRTAFRALHQSGCFILPNPWDIGSAKRLAALGFKAIASSSSAAARALGVEDYELTRNQVLDHLAMLNAATDLPVNADFENGFANAPDAVAINVKSAAATGIAGLSIEDRHGNELYDFDLAVARIAAAREALGPEGTGPMLVARTEIYLMDQPDHDEARRRLVAFADAGADCLYAPGITDRGEIAAIVKAVAPKPVNVILMNDDMTVRDLAALGVRRVSVGGALSAVAWAAFDDAACALAAQHP